MCAMYLVFTAAAFNGLRLWERTLSEWEEGVVLAAASTDAEAFSISDLTNAIEVVKYIFLTFGSLLARAIRQAVRHNVECT